MVRVGPYEFDHDEVSEGGNRYIAWTELPSGASSHRATNEILWADSGLIVEWLFELGRDEPTGTTTANSDLPDGVREMTRKERATAYAAGRRAHAAAANTIATVDAVPDGPPSLVTSWREPFPLRQSIVEREQI